MVLLCSIPSYLGAEWNPGLLRVHPHPLHLSGPRLFPGPLVLWKGTRWPPGSKVEVEQWGALGSGVQVRCARAAGPQDRIGRPARAAALCSFVPPQRRGLLWVSFPAGDGIDSPSQRGKGRGRGWNGNQIGKASPKGCLLEAAKRVGWWWWWGAVMRAPWRVDYKHTTLCPKAVWVSGLYL